MQFFFVYTIRSNLFWKKNEFQNFVEFPFNFLTQMSFDLYENTHEIVKLQV